MRQLIVPAIRLGILFGLLFPAHHASATKCNSTFFNSAPLYKVEVSIDGVVESEGSPESLKWAIVGEVTYVNDKAEPVPEYGEIWMIRDIPGSGDYFTATPTGVAE